MLFWSVFWPVKEKYVTRIARNDTTSSEGSGNDQEQSFADVLQMLTNVLIMKFA